VRGLLIMQLVLYLDAEKRVQRIGDKLNKMPYELKKTNSGFKVCKKNSTKCFSKKPLPRKRALKQLAALHIATKESTLINIILQCLNENRHINKE
jgi:hypothetical protein